MFMSDATLYLMFAFFVVYLQLYLYPKYILIDS